MQVMQMRVMFGFQISFLVINTSNKMIFFESVGVALKKSSQSQWNASAETLED